MTVLGICHFCSDPVDSSQSVAWPVSGWEAERGQGGANRIIYRRRLTDGRIAHTGCAELEAARDRRGIHHDQSSLI